MSVTEADSSVLQPLTNGDSTVSIINKEAQDTSTELKDNVQPEEKLNVVKIGGPVGKATEITVETSSPLASELDNVPNVQAPVESSTSDAPYNGSTEAHATDVASPTFEGTGVGAPDATIKEQVAHISSIENLIPEPNEVNPTQQLSPVEKEETLTEAATERPADMTGVSEASSIVFNAAGEAVPPTIEGSKEDVPATATDEPKLEKSMNAQPEPTTAASTSAASDSTSSLVEPTPSSSVSEEPSPIPAEPKPEPEVISTAVIPGVISAYNETETLPIKTPTTSPAEFVIEVAPSEAVDLGIPASQPSEAKPEEEVTQAEAVPNTTETIPVLATTVEEVPSSPPVVDIAEATNEMPVAKDSAKAIQAFEASSAVEPVTVVIAPEVHETSPLVEPLVPPIETTIVPKVVPAPAPETEAVKEPIVEPSIIVKEVAPPVAEPVIESAAEPVTSTEDVPNEEATIPEPVVKEESVSVDNATVSSEPAQPVATAEVQSPFEVISVDVSASTEDPVSVPVENISTATSVELSAVDNQPIDVASSAGPSVEISPAATTVPEVVVAGSAEADADIHVPIEVEEPVTIKEKVVAEEEVVEPVIPEAVEPAKEEVAFVTPPIEATVAPETVSATAPETEAVEKSIVEPSTVVKEVAPSVAELVTESATEPVTRAEDATSEEVIAPEPVVREEPVSIDNAAVSSEPAQPVATEVHAPPKVIPEEASVLTEAPVSVPIENVSTAAPAELPTANDQLIEVPSSTGPSAELSSAEIVVVESAVANVAVHVPAEVPTEVEEPVTVKEKAVVEESVVEPTVPEVTESRSVKEGVVEVATTDFVMPGASEVDPEEVSTAPALDVRDVASAVSEHDKTSIEPEPAEASNNSAEVSQPASTTGELVAASVDTLDVVLTPATQDDVASTAVGPVLEKPSIADIPEAPASDEVESSPEEAAPPSQTTTAEESAARDVDIPSNVAPSAGHPESIMEQPTPAFLPAEQPLEDVIVEDSATAKEAPIEEHALVPAIPLEGPVVVHNDDTTVTEVIAEERSAEPKETIAEPALASEEPIKTLVVEPAVSSDETGTQSMPEEDTSVPVVERASGSPQNGGDGTEQSGVVIDEEPVVSQESDVEHQEVVSVDEKALITPAAVTTVDELTSDPETAVSKDDHSVAEQIEAVSAVEEAALTPVPEVSSTEKEAEAVEQVQAIPVEGATPISVETVGETAIEEPLSVPVTEVLTQHEETQATDEESTLTKRAVVVGSEDKVEPRKDAPVIDNGTLEEVTPVSTPDFASTKEAIAEQVQADAVVEEPATAETIVEAAVKEVNLASPAEPVVTKHKETLLVVGESEHLQEATKSQDQIEPPKDGTSPVDRATIEEATSAEIVAAQPLDSPSVTTTVTAEEEPTKESTLSQDEVEAVVASIPSVAEVPTEAANVPELVVEVAGQVNDELKETTAENVALDVGADVERPKSPWTPSFQVTTIGRGVSPDEQLRGPDMAEPVVNPFTETNTESAEAEEPDSIEKSSASVQVTTDAEEVLQDVGQSVISHQLVIDKSSLLEPAAEESSEAPAEESRPRTLLYSSSTQGHSRPDNVKLEEETQEPSARPWTPSYSVHSQGSPLPIQADLVEEPTQQEDKELFVDHEDEAVELEEMKFADNEDASAITSNIPPDQQAPSQEVSANVFSEKQEALADVAPPLTTDVETNHPSEPTGPYAEAAFGSVHTEVKDSSEAISASVEQNNPVHVLQVEDDVNDTLIETAAPVTDTEVPQLVLDANKEALVPSVSAFEQISEGLAPRVEEKQASPWVASYSVIVQGSPTQERPSPLDKEATAIAEPSVAKSEDVELEAAVIEVPTISAKNVAETQDHEAPSAEIAKAEVTKTLEEPVEDSTVKEISAVPTPSVGDDRVEKELPTAATVASESFTNPDNQELLKSLRTPSQPVATQGISSTDEAELNKSEPLVPLVQQTDGSLQDTVSQRGSSDDKFDLDSSMAVDVVKMATNPVGEVFPTAEELAAEQQKKSKPSGLRLTTSNENATTDSSSASSDVGPPGRSRLESTASSRFFPGGWFSPSKTVDESRAFLEIARGEFTAKKLASTSDPSIDEGPSVAEPATETQGEANEEPRPASNERRSRWCIIM